MTDSDSPSDREPSRDADGQPIVTIRCREHGPLVVELPAGPDGPAVGLRVTDHLGQAFPLPAHKRAVALCRCGQTKTVPFCDGSHKDCVFSAAKLASPADTA